MLYWNRKIDVGKGLEHNKPDLVIMDKINKKWTLIDFSVPWDGNVKIKEATEIRSIYKVRTEIIPIIVGAL